MRLLDYKTSDQLNEIGYSLLSQQGIDAETQGSIARLLLHVYNDIMGEFYDVLNANHVNAFLSTAKDEFLDAIGFLLNCTRISNEEDDIYRDRISKQTLTLAAANETAIRLAALSVDGVQDIRLKKYTMGTGSFSMFVLTKDAFTPEETLRQVEAAVNETVGYGNKFDVSTPKLLEVELGVKLFFVLTASEASKVAAKADAKQALKDYVNSRGIGDPIIVDEITQRVMEVSDDVLKYELYTMTIAGREVKTVDQTPRWDERYIESASKQEAIITS